MAVYPAACAVLVCNPDFVLVQFFAPKCNSAQPLGDKMYRTSARNVNVPRKSAIGE